jgi:hypothetical protein
MHWIGFEDSSLLAKTGCDPGTVNHDRIAFSECGGRFRPTYASNRCCILQKLNVNRWAAGRHTNKKKIFLPFHKNQCIVDLERMILPDLVRQRMASNGTSLQCWKSGLPPLCRRLAAVDCPEDHWAPFF